MAELNDPTWRLGAVPTPPASAGRTGVCVDAPGSRGQLDCTVRKPQEGQVLTGLFYRGEPCIGVFSLSYSFHKLNEFLPVCWVTKE